MTQDVDVAPDLENGFIINGYDIPNRWRTNVECVLERRGEGRDRQFSYLSNECRAESVSGTIFDGRLYESCVLTTWDGIFNLRHGSYTHGFNPAKNATRRMPESPYEDSGLTTFVRCAERPVHLLSFEEAFAFFCDGPSNNIYMRVDYELGGFEYSLYAPCRYTNYPNVDLISERYLQPISGYVIVELDDRFYMAYVAAHVKEDVTEATEFICRDRLSFVQTKPKTGSVFWLFSLLDKVLLKRVFVTDEFHRVLRVDGDCTFFTYRDG